MVKCFFYLGPSLSVTCMRAITALRFEKMESLSAIGNDWQVLRVSGRRVGGGSNALTDQKMDEWGWALGLLYRCHSHNNFWQSIVLWHQSIRCQESQHEL